MTDEHLGREPSESVWPLPTYDEIETEVTRIMGFDRGQAIKEMTNFVMESVYEIALPQLKVNSIMPERTLESRIGEVLVAPTVQVNQSR